MSSTGSGKFSGFCSYCDNNEKEDYDRVKEEKEKYDLYIINQMVYGDIRQEEYKEEKRKILTEQVIESENEDSEEKVKISEENGKILNISLYNKYFRI